MIAARPLPFGGGVVSAGGYWTLGRPLWRLIDGIRYLPGLNRCHKILSITVVPKPAISGGRRFQALFLPVREDILVLLIGVGHAVARAEPARHVRGGFVVSISLKRRGAVDLRGRNGLGLRPTAKSRRSAEQTEGEAK